MFAASGLTASPAFSRVSIDPAALTLRRQAHSAHPHPLPDVRRLQRPESPPALVPVQGQVSAPGAGLQGVQQLSRADEAPAAAQFAVPADTAPDSEARAIGDHLLACYGVEPGQTPPPGLRTFIDERVAALRQRGFTLEELLAQQEKMPHRDALAAAMVGGLAWAPFAAAGYAGGHLGRVLEPITGPGTGAVTGAAVAASVSLVGSLIKPDPDIYYSRVPQHMQLDARAAVPGRLGALRSTLAQVEGFAEGWVLKEMGMALADLLLSAQSIPRPVAAQLRPAIESLFLVLLGGPAAGAAAQARLTSGQACMAVSLARPDYLEVLENLRGEAPLGSLQGIGQRLGRAAGSTGRMLASIRPDFGGAVRHTVSPGTLGEALVLGGLFTADGLVTPRMRAALQHLPMPLPQLLGQALHALMTVPMVAVFPAVRPAVEELMRLLRQGVSGGVGDQAPAAGAGSLASPAAIPVAERRQAAGPTAGVAAGAADRMAAPAASPV